MERPQAASSPRLSGLWCWIRRKWSPGFRIDPFSPCPGRCVGSQQHPGHTCRQAGRICCSRNQTRISWWDEQPSSWGEEAEKEKGREWNHFWLPKVLSRPRTDRGLLGHTCAVAVSDRVTSGHRRLQESPDTSPGATCRAVTQKPRIRRWVGGTRGFSSPSVSGGRVQLWGLGCSHSLLRHGSIPRALLTPALSPRCQSRSSRRGASAPLASEPLPAALRQLLGSQGRWRLSLRAVPASHSQLRVFPAKKCFFFSEPICSLGTTWCSQSHEDDEGAAKIENPLSDSASALWAGDGNKDCPWG